MINSSSPSRPEIPEDWCFVGKFSDTSAVKDPARTFLEAIPKFNALKETETVIPVEGYPMPNLSGIGITRIIGLEFVPDQDTPIADRTQLDGNIYFIKPLA